MWMLLQRSHLDSRKLAVSDYGHWFIFQKSDWLEHEFKNESQTGLWCIKNGDLAVPAASRTDSTFGSRVAARWIPARSAGNFWKYTALRVVWAVPVIVSTMLWQKAFLAASNRSESTGVIIKPVFSSARCVAVHSMFYNSHRLHSYLGYKSPKQYEIETEKLKNVSLTGLNWILKIL